MSRQDICDKENEENDEVCNKESDGLLCIARIAAPNTAPGHAPKLLNTLLLPRPEV